MLYAWYNIGYLFNDPLEDTEMCTQTVRMGWRGGYLFNDPLEDTEIWGRGIVKLWREVTCSTIR